MKPSKLSWLGRSAIFAVILTHLGSLHAQEVWCAREYIVGLQSVAETAISFLGPKTTINPEEMNVYVSVENWEYAPGMVKPAIYVHSNYHMPGGHPIKIATTRTNIDITFLINELAQARNRNLDLSRVKYYVEHSIFRDENYGKLDFGYGKNVKVICPDGKPRPSIKAQLDKDKYTRLVFLSPYITTWVTDVNSLEVFDSVSKQSFNPNNLRLLNLVIHNKTKDSIDEHFPAANRIEFDLDLLKTQERSASLGILEAQLAASPNTVLFALGHVEEGSGDFVSKDASNEEVLRLPISELQSMAEKYNITLMALGCNTANYAQRGTKQKIDSLYAIERLSAAMQKANTYGEFLRALSSRKLGFVIDSGAVEGVRIRMKISLYNKPASEGSPDGSDREREVGGGSGAGGTVGSGSGRGWRRPPQLDGTLNISYSPPSQTGSPSVPPSPHSGPSSDDGQMPLLVPGLLVIVASGVVGVVIVKCRRRRPQEEAQYNEIIITSCPNCYAKNRVIKNRLENSKCGKCHERIQG